MFLKPLSQKHRSTFLPLQDAATFIFSVDWGFGDDDLYFIAEMPDDASATAASLAIAASGSATIRTTVLVTPETVDEAVRKSVSYRPPES